MEKVKELMNHGNSLLSYASELESAITKVALVCDQSDDSRNNFPEKKDVMETMANSVEKMRQVAALISGISLDNDSNSPQQDEHPKMNDAIVRDLRQSLSDYQDCYDKIGVVLDELVKMLDLDGTGIDIYLLLYVAETHETLRGIIKLVSEIK